MPAPDSITTIVDLGATIRYTQPVSRVQDEGVVVGIIRHRGTPWLKVAQRTDQAQVVVGLHEVVRVVQDAPVIEAPVLAIPTVRVAIGTGVRFITASGHKAVGWVQEIDGDVLLVEREDTTLELITLDDLVAMR